MKKESGFAQEVDFQASELPAWIRRGGCALNKISRSFLTAQTGRSIKLQNKFSVELSRPPRPLPSRRLRSISWVASTPPDPGGEFARLKIGFLLRCKA